jgi:glycosyltransferase involved in cell wall biosynthesis
MVKNKLRASIIVPVRNEEKSILTFLDQLSENSTLAFEALLIVDDPSDLTFSVIPRDPEYKFELRLLVSNYGRGPANAIKFGLDSARSDIAVVVMADGSDDTRNIEDLVRLIERGCVVAAASRYMPGGQQIGGPFIKRFMSRNASRFLRIIGGVEIHDSTNSFKAYSIPFIKSVSIESTQGFEIGLEIVAKAHRSKMLIAEIPTIWIERQAGNSNFKLVQWLPHYMRWFNHAILGFSK